MIFDIAIIGAGASGLMTASMITDKSVAIIDVNAKMGLKILASGGGKCNVTNKNISSKNYLGNETFIKQALQNFTSKDTLDFLQTHNISLELRKYGQYFCKNSAKDLVNIFTSLTKKHHFFFSYKVLHVSFKNHFFIQCDKGVIEAKKVVVASGGMSYAALGASDIGYGIAKSFGHSIITPAPALVGLCVQKEQFWMKELSGISCPAKIKVKEKVFEADLLFTHKGISGPVVLSTSLYWDKGKISIDFLPNTHLEKLFIKESKKQISSILPLPKRFTKEFLKALHLIDKKIYELKESEKEFLKLQLHSYEFAPAGNFGYSKAEVTKGGVNTTEINPISFESSLQKGLYFIGEVLDVTGELGGYNFQWAFASANSLVTHI